MFVFGGWVNRSVLIVTGAAGVLGQAVALHLGACGFRLLLVDRLQPEWDGESDAVSVGNVDLTLPEHAQEVVNQAWSYFGRIDGVLNLAGGFVCEEQVESSLDAWNEMFACNVQTAVNMCQAVLPQFQAQQHGLIVNVGAVSALQAIDGLGAYAASKAAVLRLTEALAAENKSFGIRVNAVLPSVIDTPANRTLLPDAHFEDWVSPQSLAEVIAFLCSNAARDIHGALIPVVGRV
jgi:NAD(P)-dependent dehydrogenase (short-subunit alcohol dehydrogenase family)